MATSKNITSTPIFSLSILAKAISSKPISVAVPTAICYSPLTSSYTRATFTPVTIPVTSSFSFRVKGLDNSTSLRYFAQSSGTSAFVYYRGSDGRFRVSDDAGTLSTINGLTILNDGGEYLVQVQMSPTGINVLVDGVSQGTTTGVLTDITLDSLADPMTVGTLYGVTLGGLASWTMQSENDDEFNAVDEISGNDLTYVGEPVPITNNDTTSTTCVTGV